MKASYLGLELRSPVIVGSSPFTASLKNIEACAAAGAGAVVLKSIFEEQIVRHAAALEAVSDSAYGDAAEYLHYYLGAEYRAEYLSLIAGARAAVSIPVIASINCVAAGDEWIRYATETEAAGASALELNIFVQPTDPRTSSAELETMYAALVRRVCEAVKIPVSVKLSMRFTNVVAVADSLVGAGAKGVVLFNRFFEPDVDIERVAFVEGAPFSEASELRNVLRPTAIVSGAVPQLDVAVSTGVHDGAAAVKALLCGASAVQLCTALHNGGFEAVGEIAAFIDRWAERHGYGSLDEFRGKLDFRNHDSDIFQRVQYMKYFPGRD